MGCRAVEKFATPCAILTRMSKDNWGEGTLYLRGKTYWIQYCVNGKRRRQSTKTTDIRKARKILRDKLTGAQRGDSPETNVRIERLLDNLLRFYSESRPKSAAWAQIVVETHLRKPFEFVRASSLGTDRINAYIDERRAKGIKNATINRELALLRRAYSLGMKHEPPLVHRVPRIEELAEGAPRSGFFEAPEFARLCAELSEDVRDVAVFAYWTGCRKSEILGLRWTQVDFADRVVRLEITKSGEPREIPLGEDLFAVLARRRDECAEKWPWCHWVFNRDGKRIVNFYTSWNSACERAKLNGSSLLHDLRRTGVRNLVRAGVPEKVAMLISGHKTRSVFDRYHIVQGDDLKEAMLKLEKHLRGKK